MARQPAPKFLLPMILSVPVLGIGLGVLMVGMKKGGFLTTTDVGALGEIAPFQEKLRALDACEIRYAGRDKRGNRSHTTSVFITACTGRDVTTIGVPLHRDVGYELTRRDRAQPYKVLVEKDEVPFSELVATLQDHTPRIVAELDKKQTENRTRDAAYQRQLDEQRAKDQERKSKAKESYPTK